MDTILYAAFAICYIVLLAWGIALARQAGGLSAADTLLPVIVALIYDNGILALGRFVGEGPLLETLNGARYWLHAFLTPLLVIFAWHAVARAGVGFARQSWAWLPALLIYVALVAVDLLTEVRGLRLEPVREYGALSYSSVEPATGPPAMILGVTLVLLIAAALVWWKQRWPWFAVGVLLMTLGSAVPLPIESAAITNAFELILITSLLATRHFQDRAAGGATRPDASPAPEPRAAWR